MSNIIVGLSDKRCFSTLGIQTVLEDFVRVIIVMKHNKARLFLSVRVAHYSVVEYIYINSSIYSL